MNCEKCGATLEKGAKFCQNCGARIEPKEPLINEPVATPAAESKPTETVREITGVAIDAETVKNKVTQLSKKAKIAIGAAAAVILLIIILAAGGGKTICLSDYTTVSFTGYDTVGKAAVQIDEDRLYADFAQKASKKNSQIDWEAWFGDYAYRGALANNAMYTLSSSEGLCNGDTVQLTWTINEDAIKESFGVKVTAKDKEYKVSDLPKPIPFDPFEDVVFKFEGVDGEGKLSGEITSDKSIYEALYFDSDTKNNLSNGDTVTIVLCASSLYSSDDIKTYCIENYGMTPTAVSKDYTVEGLGQYITASSQLTAKAIDGLKAHSKEALEELIASGKSTLKSSEYLGYCILFPKTDGDYYYAYGKRNNICCVYKIVVDFSNNEQSEEQEYYTYISYHDVSINSDEECSANWNDYYYPSKRIYSPFAKWLYPHINAYETLQEVVDSHNSDSYVRETHLDGNV